MLLNRGNMSSKLALLLLSAMLLFVGCKEKRQSLPDPSRDETGGSDMNIKITSSAFDEGGMIPSKYTCDGEDVSPPLAWSGIPDGTKSIVLICDDPDAPGGTWVHWVLYNLPPETSALDEALPATETLSDGARHGVTDFGEFGYGGPCPPSKTHRYYFKLYALDTKFTIDGEATKEAVEAAMRGHILAEGQLMGRYARK
jgi:Raf kinase inhibitor-like YbhB/YbcL family protein